MHPRRARLTGALLLALSCPALAGPDSSSLLFEAPALVGVPTGTTLIYRLERTTEPGAGAHGTGSSLLPSTSTVELSMHPDTAMDGREAKIEIVTGERRQAAGPFPSRVGNPVLLVILERDVAEMSRTLHGSPYYLRNRIREALGQTTLAEPARFTFEGREIEGWRVVVSPFAQDRNRDKLREYAAKRYEFTLSDTVPGRLYGIRMVTPGADGAPLVEDRLTFERSQPPGGDAR
jgi:hypothetical protein